MHVKRSQPWFWLPWKSKCKRHATDTNYPATKVNWRKKKKNEWWTSRADQGIHRRGVAFSVASFGAELVKVALQFNVSFGDIVPPRKVNCEEWLKTNQIYRSSVKRSGRCKYNSGGTVNNMCEDGRRRSGNWSTTGQKQTWRPSKATIKQKTT